MNRYPERWTYSSLYNVTGAVLNATVPGPQCVQYGSGSEDCLYLNIQTPYIAAQGTKQDLRPGEMTTTTLTPCLTLMLMFA